MRAVRRLNVRNWALADIRRFRRPGQPEPFLPMIFAEHVPVYVPAVRLLSETRVVREAPRSSLRVALRPVNPNQLGIIAMLVVGPDVVQDKYGFHAAGMRRSANVRYWAKADVREIGVPMFDVGENRPPDSHRPCVPQCPAI
jgi:hypothetical protein